MTRPGDNRGRRPARSRLVKPRLLLEYWRHLRGKDRARARLILGAVILILATEVVWHGLGSFYTDHPLQAGIVTGVLLSLVAYFVVDAIRAELNEKRWEPLSKLAFISLAEETTQVIDTMLWVVTGIDPKHKPTDPRLHKELLQVRAVAGVPLPAHDDLGAVEGDEYASRLPSLLSDPNWVDFALRRVSHAKSQNREGLARWASAMLTNPDSADVLSRLVDFNELLSQLQEWLRVLAAYPGYEKLRATPDQAAASWLKVHAEAVSLREDLTRVSRGVPKVYEGFRKALGDEPHIQAIATRDRQVAKGEVSARDLLVTPLISQLEHPPADTAATKRDACA
jgi:hypothetical protein